MGFSLLLLLISFTLGISSLPPCTGGNTETSQCSGWYLTLYVDRKSFIYVIIFLALIDFYHATNGESWVKKSNWMDGDPCANKWEGISCKGTTKGYSVVNSMFSIIICRVSFVYLTFHRSFRYNSLVGTLPPSIGDLRNLNTMWAPHLYVVLSNNFCYVLQRF